MAVCLHVCVSACLCLRVCVLCLHVCGCGASACQVLVLAPAIVVRNWEAECSNFLPEDILEDMGVRVFDGTLVRRGGGQEGAPYGA